MSSLDKMSIMGIRSFAPDSNQIVTFFSPLTLILGPNGTGKTTIIEALRYITTGDMPPNSSRGAAFIHDPKIAHEVEVRAQIKLKFRDAKGKEVTTTRSMVATQKQKKLDFRSLDGTILRKNDDGKDVSISSKCAELDREVQQIQSVSKAILNNVIFCHQEDSNWPLSEGKALKVKFDEIFAATRYIKALDNLHKLRLENDNEAKLFANELKFLAQYKEKANDLRADLEKTETRLAVSLDRVKAIVEKMKPIDASLDEIYKTESIIVEVQTQIARKESELKVELKSSQELDSKIVNTFVGSDEQLEREMDNFKRQLETKKEEKQELENTIKKLNRETPQLASKRSDVLLNLGKLRTESEQHQKRIADRDQLVDNVCQKLNITVSKDRQEMSKGQIERELEAKIASLSRDHQSIKDKYSEKEKELYKKQNTLRDAKTKIQHTETMRTKQINDARETIRQLSKDLSRVEASAPRLQILDEELKRKEKELKEVTNEMNVKSAQVELEGFQKDISRLNTEIRELDAEMMRLHKQADVQAELDLARKEKVNKEDAIRRLKSKHEDTIIHLIGSFPTEDIQKKMATFTQELSREINKLKTHRDTLQVEIATNESNRKMIMAELQRKEEELRSSEEEIFETCGSHNLDSGLSQLQTSIKNLHDEKGALTGTSYLYGKFIEKLHKKEPCCPVCHRSFNDQQDVEDLVGDLKMKLNFLPEELESKQKTLQEQQEKYNKLLEMKPIKSRVESLNSKEIPELRAKVKKLAADIEKTKSRKAEVEEMLMLKEADESAATPMQSDLVLLEQNISELKKVDKRIEQSRSRMIGGDSGRTIAQVNKEKLEMQADLDTLSCLQKNKQTQLNNHMERVQGLQAETNRLGSEQLQISRDMQKVNEMEGRRTELTNEVSAYRKEIEDIRKQMAPLEKDIGELNEKLEQLVIQKEEALDESQQKINEIRTNQKDLSTIQKEITKYIEKKRPQMLEECQKELERIDIQFQSHESKKQATNNQWQLLCKEIDCQQTQVRDLQDSFELRAKRKHIQSVKQDIAELKSRLGGYNIDTMRTEKKNLEKQSEGLRAERNKAEGGQRELEENIRKLRKELTSSTYGDADKNYKEKLIQLKTTKLASSDLTKYSLALDGAIMQYHSLKMKEINKIVRDLWNKTYQGNDIDFIEIRSDVDEISNVATGSGRRKQYKYRVVMIKGDVEQDMRGRCSAGQKVLASLIIRLGLAETFCLNCGILALDEPTTNLDRDNIESLADALSNIVKSRSQQRNFQLIVITHDEDFLERLGRSDFVDYYYRVGKNEKGNSVVKRCHVQTLP